MVVKTYRIPRNEPHCVGEESIVTDTNVATNEEKNREERLFDYLEEVLDVCRKKFKNHRKKDKSRLPWGRLFVNAIKAYGQISHNIELEKLRRRLDSLPEEVTVHLGYGIQPKDPKKYVKPIKGDKT